MTVTLDSILDHAKVPAVVDYFSLDVEGAEYHVLQNFNFSRYTFLTMSIERPSSKVHHLLVQHGYRFVKDLCDFGDCLYAHHTLPNFVEVMNTMHNITYLHSIGDYVKHPKWEGAYIPVHEETTN